MKTQLLFSKTTILLTALLFGISFASIAGTFTASTSGNWSNATTWGGNGPGFNLTGTDNIVVPTGITVAIDSNLIINNAASLLTITGSLAGITNLTLTAGIIQLNTGAIVTLANNATIIIGSGSFGMNGGSLLTLGNYNLLYTGSALKTGAELSLNGLQNVTVDLLSPSSQLDLSANLAVGGILAIQQGVLNLNGKDLAINHSINTAAAGSISGNANSNIIINGTGNVGMIAFASVNQTLNNLTLNIGSGGSLSLSSNMIVAGALSLNEGSLKLNGYDMILEGTMRAEGNGSIFGNKNSTLTLNGSGNMGTLMLNSSNDTLASLTVNIGQSGSVILGTELVLTGTPALSLSDGSLSLNGQNLTIGGAILTTGSGSISGDANSNLIFNGSGGAGTLVFTPGNQTINNITIDIAFAGAVFVNSDLSVLGSLSLVRGEIGIGDNDLTIGGNGTVLGGSALSYIITNGAGSLIMPLANEGAAGMFQVGTQVGYAPVTITNNSVTAGSFGVNAHNGILAGGTTGADLANTQGVVNTTWDISSSVTTGANVNLEMFWNTNMQVNGFDNEQAYISHYTNGAWNTSAVTAATTINANAYSLTLSGVTSFSQFAVFDKNATTAITDLNATLATSIYPNPATNQINVSVKDPGNFLTMKIYDALGNQISSQAIVNSVTALDIRNLTPGVYFASFNNNETRKFIKE